LKSTSWIRKTERDSEGCTERRVERAEIAVAVGPGCLFGVLISADDDSPPIGY
jgi:hypothetical protein